jgi:ankyrin repeat protein
MSISVIDNHGYELHLLGFSFRLNSNKKDLYTLMMCNKKEFPIMSEDKVLFFNDLKLTENAWNRAQNAINDLDFPPEEKEFSIDVAGMTYLVSSGFEDENGSIINCLNMFFDFLEALNIPLPKDYKERLFATANHLTFEAEFKDFLKEHKINREELIEAIDWCLDKILANSKVITFEGEFPLFDWLKENKLLRDIGKSTETLSELEQFMLAAQYGEIKKIKTFLNKGIDVNTKYEDGYTALHWAAQEGYEELARFLIRKDADINSIDEEGRTPLEIACSNQQFRIVKLLFENNADHTISSNGFTPLHAAASGGSVEIVNFLLDKGLNIHARDENGIDWTPLHWVGKEGTVKVARLLIDRGADIYSKAMDGCTPLHIAAIHANYDVVEFFAREYKDLNVQSDNGSTPLHMACINRNDTIVRLLADHGADIEVRDNEDKTILHQAAKKCITEIVEFLLSREADISAQDIDGKTPLDLAMESKCKKNIELLKEAQNQGPDKTT